MTNGESDYTQMMKTRDDYKSNSKNHASKKFAHGKNKNNDLTCTLQINAL